MLIFQLQKEKQTMRFSHIIALNLIDLLYHCWSVKGSRWYCLSTCCTPFLPPFQTTFLFASFHPGWWCWNEIDYALLFILSPPLFFLFHFLRYKPKYSIIECSEIETGLIGHLHLNEVCVYTFLRMSEALWFCLF